MKLKTIMMAIFGLVLSFNVKAQNKIVSGIAFPEKLNIENQSMNYNGAGVRTTYFIKTYGAALYLPKLNANNHNIVNENEISAILLKITSDRVNHDRFTKAVRKKFTNSSEGKATQQDINAFIGLLKTEIDKEMKSYSYIYLTQVLMFI